MWPDLIISRWTLHKKSQESWAKCSGQRKVNNFAIQLLFPTWHLFILKGPALQLYSALRGKYALQIPQTNIAMLTSTSTSSYLLSKNNQRIEEKLKQKPKLVNHHAHDYSKWQRPLLCITIKNNTNWDALQFPVQPIIRLDKKLAVSKCYKCLN